MIIADAHPLSKMYTDDVARLLRPEMVIVIAKATRRPEVARLAAQNTIKATRIEVTP
jgi:hypothetical protein